MGCSSSSAQTVEQEKRPGTKPEESNGETAALRNGNIAEDAQTIEDQMQPPLQNALLNNYQPEIDEEEEAVLMVLEAQEDLGSGEDLLTTVEPQPEPDASEEPAPEAPAAAPSVVSEVPAEALVAPAAAASVARVTTAPAEVTLEVPTEAPAEVPFMVPTETPAAAPAETPLGVRTETPAEAPLEVPTEVPAAAPTETPLEVPTEVPAAAPAETPLEVPTEVPATEPPAPTQTPDTSSSSQTTLEASPALVTSQTMVGSADPAQEPVVEPSPADSDSAAAETAPELSHKVETVTEASQDTANKKTKAD